MALFRLYQQLGERRRGLRHEVHYLAQIECGETPLPVNCIISDLSSGGARLTIGLHHSVPDEFTLVFRRRCRVVRRADGQVGVQFNPGS